MLFFLIITKKLGFISFYRFLENMIFIFKISYRTIYSSTTLNDIFQQPISMIFLTEFIHILYHTVANTVFFKDRDIFQIKKKLIFYIYFKKSCIVGLKYKIINHMLRFMKHVL
jgi:hypothetical protein